MFGNIINNTRLIDFINEGVLTIDPFSLKKLKTIHYPLTPYTVLSPEGRRADGEFRTAVKYQFQTEDDFFEFKVNEYFIIEIEEYITASEGIVGHFIPSSNLIMQGFGLTAGRIEFPFGHTQTGRLKIRFGLTNLLNKPNKLLKSDYLAYVYFIDLRGLNNKHVDLTDRDRVLFEAWKKRKRKAEDDGPIPDDDE